MLGAKLQFNRGEDLALCGEGASLSQFAFKGVKFSLHLPSGFVQGAELPVLLVSDTLAQAQHGGEAKFEHGHE
jgi:hypothetical protein